MSLKKLAPIAVSAVSIGAVFLLFSWMSETETTHENNPEQTHTSALLTDRTYTGSEIAAWCAINNRELTQETIDTIADKSFQARLAPNHPEQALEVLSNTLGVSWRNVNGKHCLTVEEKEASEKESGPTEPKRRPELRIAVSAVQDDEASEPPTLRDDSVVQPFLESLSKEQSEKAITTGTLFTGDLTEDQKALLSAKIESNKIDHFVNFGHMTVHVFGKI